MNEIKLFSPATVANVSCGFDVLGFCLDSIGDEMVIRKTAEKGIRITKIEGYDLPFEVEKNVAGVSALAMYEAAKPNCGFEIEIYKYIKPGSGVGSSSASAVGSVYGMNVLLGNPYSKTELTAFAMKGEAVASQSEHADNIAPALFGGFTLVKSLKPLEILEIPTPSDLFAVVIHPQIEIKTADARKILPENISLKNAITQWSNVGSLIHGLHTNDYDLISRSLEDVVVEPAIALGNLFNSTLGSKLGIERYGFCLPMDDCLAQVAIDFGGRNWLVWDADFKREYVGKMPT